ncbi:hypothetical protein GCM10020219_057050 [Nonomuraea dietziae]
MASPANRDSPVGDPGGRSDDGSGTVTCFAQDMKRQGSRPGPRTGRDPVHSVHRPENGPLRTWWSLFEDGRDGPVGYFRTQSAQNGLSQLQSQYSRSPEYL